MVSYLCNITSFHLRSALEVHLSFPIIRADITYRMHSFASAQLSASFFLKEWIQQLLRLRSGRGLASSLTLSFSVLSCI
jgi:hypothetical protein